MNPLSKVSIGIKSLLRPRLLYHACYNIETMLDGARMIIVDDSGDFGDSQIWDWLIKLSPRHDVVFLPFDSGFGKKSNTIVEFLETPYLLVGSDDFDFSPLSVRYGILKMVDFLDNNPDFRIVSGRVNNRPYEFDLVDYGDTIIEKKVEIPNHPNLESVEVDLTVNYSMIRKEVFQKVRWDDDVKIGGGEHGAFFVDCMRAGFKTAYLPGVNIMEQANRIFSPKYVEMRSRASSPERPCFAKRGIKKYVLGDGTIDYDQSITRS